jgi:hypothetical protein
MRAAASQALLHVGAAPRQEPALTMVTRVDDVK